VACCYKRLRYVLCSEPELECAKSGGYKEASIELAAGQVVRFASRVDRASSNGGSLVIEIRVYDLRVPSLVNLVLELLLSLHFRNEQLSRSKHEVWHSHPVIVATLIERT